MDDLLKWLPLLAALASPIAVIVTLRSQAKFSEWRHEQHERRFEKLEDRVQDHATKLAVLEAGAKDDR